MSVQYQDRRARVLIEKAKVRIDVYRKYNNIDYLRQLIVGESTFAILVTNFQTGRLEHSAFAVMEALYDDYREHPELEINKAVQSVFDDALIVEETARQCIQMNSCRYKTFKQVLNRVISTKDIGDTGTLPSHDNIRGKGFYK